MWVIMNIVGHTKSKNKIGVDSILGKMKIMKIEMMFHGWMKYWVRKHQALGLVVELVVVVKVERDSISLVMLVLSPVTYSIVGGGF